MDAFDAARDQKAAQGTKESWVKPELSRISAGDAEFGATPLVPEGPIGTGS